MKQLLFIGLIFGLTNSALSQSNLADNKTFKKYFTKSEIQDIQLLFDFFNESICSDFKNQDLTICYIEFFKRMEKSGETGIIQLNIPFEKQKRIYDSFSDGTFQEIWSYGKKWNHRVAQDTFRTLNINLEGKYLKFLKSTGKNDDVIKQYSNELRATGDLSPTLIAGLLRNYDDLKIEDIRVKLIVAIHYLTLNNRFERKEKIN